MIARLLADPPDGPVRIALLGGREKLKGDTAHHAALWTDDVEAASPKVLNGAGLIIGGLFGAGLARPLEGAALALIDAMEAHEAPVIAVDLTSGVNGGTG